MLRKSVSLFAAGAFLLATPAFACEEGDQHHKQAKHTHSAQDHHGHNHDKQHKKTKPHQHAAAPKGMQLDQAIGQLEALIAAGQFSAMHEMVEAATAALNATTPPATQKVRFEGAARQLQAQLNALHTAADAGDQAASERAAKKVRGAYTLLQATLKESD
jgi:ABC-type Zn2+ transport system substrate-binding protein/surface adhesin